MPIIHCMLYSCNYHLSNKFLQMESVAFSYRHSSGRHHECWHSAQRGQPQHAGDEQQRNLAVLHPGHRSVTHHPAQHSLRQCTRGVDPHQPHSQSGEWSWTPGGTSFHTVSLNICWTGQVSEGSIHQDVINEWRSCVWTCCMKIYLLLQYPWLSSLLAHDSTSICQEFPKKDTI